MTALNRHPTDGGASAPDRLLSIADLRDFTGLGERTLRRWLSCGTLPKADYRLGGKHLRWRRETIDAWLAAQVESGRRA